MEWFFINFFQESELRIESLVFKNKNENNNIGKTTKNTIFRKKKTKSLLGDHKTLSCLPQSFCFCIFFCFKKIKILPLSFFSPVSIKTLNPECRHLHSIPQPQNTFPSRDQSPNKVFYLFIYLFLYII